MKAIVNEGCISCGACVDTCPNVFKFNEEGVAVGSDVSAADKADAQSAKDSCPVDVIDIQE